jgi:TonB family protein
MQRGQRHDGALETVMRPRRDVDSGAHTRGAVAWKVLLVIVVGAGGVWAASRLGTDPALKPPADAATALVAGTTAPTAVPRGATPAAVEQDAPTSDPFAGVDLKNNSVLRHIAGIEEKGRGRQSAPKRQPAPVTDSVPRSTDVPATQARDESAADLRARTVATVAAAAAPVQVDAPRPVATPPTAPAAEPPVVRTAVDPTPSTSAPADRAVKGATAAPASPASSSVPPGSTTLAAVRPAPAAAAPTVVAPLRVTNRTTPEFPGEAIRAGVQSGRLVARLSIDAEGRVTATQVLSATPPGVFERESRRALSTWRYEPPGQPTTTDVELIFSRE